ncbi:hypothetical protein G647_10345 [Cladophialophora carrionii CBS 160.54]|uniref:DUF7605 domain-containing protein n=1 Tax=Cladophialophora carrionii CBS 160.54 TaxID=1279043 RepID=V9DIJ0_9EURO|nr:uncharacterized protein G647_10345 [Cladophialophora carrionii CBS 160.54]ETI26685.1 hypothetical protein G647_10345 [Cladophialophora carrionii CBS 160.54]
MSEIIATRDQAAAVRLTYPPFREPSFELAATQGRNLAELIARELKKCPHELPQRLLQEAESLANVQIPTERLIGFIGNSGAGKSSSLNSVLDQVGVARTGACGSAVTPFAAEYRICQKRHHSVFTLECKLMSKGELGEYVGDLLRDFSRISTVDQEGRDLQDQKIYDDGKAAQDIFQAAFGDLEDFDMDLLEHGDDDESIERAKQHLDKCCQQLQFPDDMQDDGTWIQEAQDEEECQDQQSLLQDRGLWPFVKRLSIFSNIGILSRGLTLVDLPGFNDTNLARIRAARKAQSKCDDLCLVVDISRACDLPIVPQNLELMRAKAEAQQAACLNITIICTHSAAGLECNGTLEKMVGRAKVSKARDEIRQAEKQDEKAAKDAQRKLDTLLINTRNERVGKDLKRKYGSYVQNGNFNVFCIDNSLYSKAKTEAERELSGIPALRQHLEDLPAEPLFKATDLLLAKEIPALIGSFGNWVESCRVDPELESRPRLPEAAELEVCHEFLSEWVMRMHDVFEKCVNSPLEEGAGKICKACHDVARVWESWPHASVGSWARHDGNYRTVRIGPRCWNAELLKCFNDEVMGQSWHDFEVQTDPLLNILQANITERVTTYAAQCRELHAPANFEKSLLNRLYILRIALENARKTYMKDLGQMRLDANGAHQESYIVDCMLETYREAGRLCGHAATKKRHGILQQRVSREDFVHDFRSRLFEEFREIINRASGSIKTALRATVEAIESDLDAIRPKDGKERLFKTFPDYGADCERMLSKAHSQMEEINELAAKARAMAKEQYS